MQQIAYDPSKHMRQALKFTRGGRLAEKQSRHGLEDGHGGF
jgi:hypothetical protein